MIFSLIFKLILAVIQFLLSLLPSFDPPSWVFQIGSAAETVADSLAGTSAWVPWSALFIGVGLVMVCYVVAAAIRLVRIVASFVTLGGGA